MRVWPAEKLAQLISCLNPMRVFDLDRIHTCQAVFDASCHHVSPSTTQVT
ncbi:hypothetical protein [Mesorhizobium koreense]|nr:hypothetical protein [Mesorhizobium sp. WR6]